MDNEGGLTKLGESIDTPSNTIHSDMDLVMAYNGIREESKHFVTHEWAMGHADHKDHEKEKVPGKITQMGRGNIECEEETNEIWLREWTKRENHLPPFEPLPGYREMLKLGDNWITTHFNECVGLANISPAYG